MTAFGSYCERTASAVVENSFIIAIVNSVIAIISGVCTCAVLGYMTSEVEGDFRVYAGSALLVRTKSLYYQNYRMYPFGSNKQWDSWYPYVSLSFPTISHQFFAIVSM